MFLLVSVRRVGAHPGGHQHGVSLQISINLGNTFLRISRIRNILLTWILARVFGLYLLNEFDFYFVWSILNGVTLKTSNWGRRESERCAKSWPSGKKPLLSSVCFCLFSCSHFLNSADPTIWEPGTGQVKHELYDRIKQRITANLRVVQ